MNSCCSVTIKECGEVLAIETRRKYTSKFKKMYPKVKKIVAIKPEIEEMMPGKKKKKRIERERTHKTLNVSPQIF